MRRYWKTGIAILLLIVLVAWGWNVVTTHWFEPVRVEVGSPKENMDGEKEYFADFSLHCSCRNPFHHGHGSQFRLAVYERLEREAERYAEKNGLRRTTSLLDGHHGVDRMEGAEGCNETLKRFSVFKAKSYQ